MAKKNTPPEYGESDCMKHQYSSFRYFNDAFDI
jgi:hypothetical protein